MESDELWARGDEQKLSQQYTKAICHDSCCNPYDHPCSYKAKWFWCLWNRLRDIVYSSISWICGKAPLAEVCHQFSKSRGGCHLAQEISCSWDLWLQVSHLPWWKDCPVLEGQVAVAGWIMPNSRHEMVGNRWSYNDLPNVPVAQRCQPGVLRQLHVKGTVSWELEIIQEIH